MLPPQTTVAPHHPLWKNVVLQARWTQWLKQNRYLCISTTIAANGQMTRL